MKPKDIVLGIDFGETIESRNLNGEKVENPRAMEVIARCVKHCKKVYIVSKVNDEQKQGLLKWVADNDFLQRTGLTMDNVFFCAERYEKGPIVYRQRIKYFIDDRPEVMAFMPRLVYKVLFRPIMTDVKKWRQEQVLIVNSWTEIENLIFEET